MRAIATRADDVGAFTVHFQRHGMRHHRLCGTSDLIGRQSELLLCREHGTDGCRVGVALHEVIDEPLGFLGSQVIALHELGENRFPCDVGHDHSSFRSCYAQSREHKQRTHVESRIMVNTKGRRMRRPSISG